MLINSVNYQFNPITNFRIVFACLRRVPCPFSIIFFNNQLNQNEYHWKKKLNNQNKSNNNS